MSDLSLERQQMAWEQIENFAFYVHLDVTCDSLDGNPTGGFMFVKTRIGFQDGEYHPKIGMLHQCFGVPATLPRIFVTQPLNLSV